MPMRVNIVSVWEIVYGRGADGRNRWVTAPMPTQRRI